MVDREPVKNKTGYVIGKPVSHSKSPVIHLSAYQALGLDWAFQAVEVATDELATFLASLDPRNTSSVSVTMPLKFEAARSATTTSDVVKLTGTANTLVPRGDTWYAENTDIIGIEASLGAREYSWGHDTSAVIIGTGGTAIAALVALSNLGIGEVSVIGRSEDGLARIRELAGLMKLKISTLRLEDQTHIGADLVISTVPSSATGLLELIPDSPRVLFDVTYDPWPTELAERWFLKGGDVIGGLDLLVNQAAPQIEMATGLAAPIAVMREAVGLPRG